MGKMGRDRGRKPADGGRELGVLLRSLIPKRIVPGQGPRSIRPQSRVPWSTCSFVRARRITWREGTYVRGMTSILLIWQLRPARGAEKLAPYDAGRLEYLK